MSQTHSESVPEPSTTSVAKGGGASIAEIVGRLVHAMNENLPPGDLAQLRRLDINDPSSPAFYKLMLDMVEPQYDLPAGGEPRDRAERRWAAVFRAVARMAGLHRPNRGLGEALAASGFSELRLVRLLKARGEPLFDEIRTCTQYLSSKSESCDLTDIARLILILEPNRAEHHRRSIARSYFRQQSHVEKESQNA